MLKRPAFLVGTMRSGSTLLAECLGAHPLIAYVGFELSEEWSRHGGAPIGGDTEDPHCPALGAEQAQDGVRDALHRCFAQRLAAEGGDKPFFLNKNPHLSNKLGYLRALFPDASLIVTGRDLRSTVASTKKLFETTVQQAGGQGHFLPEDPAFCWSCYPPLPPGSTDPARSFPGGDVAVISEYWLRTYEAIDAELDSFERWAVVRHGDFVAAPKAAIGEVLGRLEIPERDFELPVAIDRGRNGRWSQLLSAAEQASLERFIAAHRGRILALRSADTTL